MAEITADSVEPPAVPIEGPMREKLKTASEICPQGKVVIPVLGELLKDSDTEVRRAAAQAIGHIGYQTPHNASDDFGRSAAAPFAPTLAELLGDRDAAVRESAVFALMWIGPNAKSAVPVIVRLLQNAEARGRPNAVRALRWIGPAARAATPALTAALNDADPQVRAAAAKMLARLQEMESE